MEFAPITASLPEGVKGGVGETDGHPARRALLVGKGQEPGPKGRGTAGTHHRVIGVIRIADVALIRRDEDVHRVHGNVRDVPLGGGPAVGGHTEGLLVGGDGDPGTNAPAPRVSGPVKGRVPGGFGTIGAALQGQFGAPYHRHGNLGIKVDGRRHRGRGVPADVGAVIPRRLEEGLALGLELLEDDRGARVPEAAPGTADLLGLVVGGDLVQEGVRVRGVVGRLVHQNLGQAGRHANGHFDVQGAFHDAVGVGFVEGETVHRHVGQGHVGKPGEALIARDVAGVIPLELHQGHGLARAGQAYARRVAVPEVAAPKKPPGRRTRAWGWGRRGGGAAAKRGRGAGSRGRRRPAPQGPDVGRRPGPPEIIQAADMGDGNVQVQGGLVLRRVKQAAVRPLVTSQADVEGFLDIRRGPPHFQKDPVGGGGKHRQMMGPHKGRHGLVVVLGGAVFFGELWGGEEMPVKRAVGVADLL